MLDTSLRSRQRESALAFEFTVENRGDEPIELSFSDAQRLRVSLCPADAADGSSPVWRSDADRMFAQVAGTETVAPGERVTFDAAWREPVSGEYRAVGEVVCENRELRAEETVLV